MSLSIQQTRSRLSDLMDAVKDVVFPLYSDRKEEAARASIRSSLTELTGADVAQAFLDEDLKDICHLICTDVEAIAQNDPAADDRKEIVYCYPAVTAMVHYRVAHELDVLGVGVIPRMLTEYAHSATGIDIHPQARIGHHFAIDHGTGVVIGQTAVIGNHVTLYQGVTVGAKNFKYDESGRPRKTTSPSTATLPSWEGSRSGKVLSSAATCGSRTASLLIRRFSKAGPTKSSWTAPGSEIAIDRDCPVAG